MIDHSKAYGQNDIEDFDFHVARLIRGRPDAECAELYRYLNANPGRTVRDWEGKGPSIPPEAAPGERPWHRLRQAEMREAATTAFARELPYNIRIAASRDPGLIWNALARKYRLRLKSDPPAKVRGRGVKKLARHEPANRSLPPL